VSTGRPAKKTEPGKNAVVSAWPSHAIEHRKDNNYGRNRQDYEYYFCNHHGASAPAQYYSDKIICVVCREKPKPECRVPSRHPDFAGMMRPGHDPSTPFGLSIAGPARDAETVERNPAMDFRRRNGADSSRR
jgi:hypothetical protein